VSVRAEPWFEAEPAVVQGLVNLIVVLADTKFAFGRCVADWAVGAPTLENSVACAAIAQEELGHARVLYPLMQELDTGGPAALERETDRERRYHPSCLDGPLATWPELVAALLLVDVAALTMIEDLQGCAFEPLARRIRRIPDEERFHLQFAEGRVRELATFDGAAEAFGAAAPTMLREMLCWFGPDGDAGVEALREAGLLRSGASALRERYLDRVVPLLLEAGVQVPIRWDLAGARWELQEELPWTEWNPLQRRLEPTPS